MSGEETVLVADAFASNWIAPLGPHVDAFEREFCDQVGAAHGAALSSGTAALHLALRLCGVGPGDDVLVSTLTFAASVNPIVYLGARPVFVDSEAESWNMDPHLLSAELERRARRGALPAAVVLVHLYGQAANLRPILDACDRFEVPLIEDAAEALGASYGSRSPGTLGRFGIFSFNGNKIITTSGGGMLVSADQAAIDEARSLASQARDPAPHYEHSRIGYNYRLSNVLAAIGRAQLRVLGQRVDARRRIFDRYREAFSDLPGIRMMPEARWGRHSRWLSCLTIDESVFGTGPDEVRKALEALDIEARPVWKPMHRQPVFQGLPCLGGAVADELFRTGLCLPSGSNLSEGDQQRVIDVVREVARSTTAAAAG